MDMKASEVAVNMMFEKAKYNLPLIQNFIRTLHCILLREDFTEYRTLPCGCRTSYTIHAGQYKTRPNSVVTPYSPSLIMSLIFFCVLAPNFFRFSMRPRMVSPYFDDSDNLFIAL